MAYEHSPLPAKFGKSTIDNNKNEERAMDEDTPKGARLPDAGIRALYTLENRWQAWLDVEAALARAQADLGIVPKDCADRIAACAKLSLLDRARIDEADKRTGHTIVPLVWELSRICGEPAGGWVHWGATTQNIVQTGDLLVLRQAHRIFIELILKTLNAMADLAERSADMVLPARTHGQHAVPATFGFKVAVWIDEFLRHLERFRQLEPRVFVAMLGGAAGTYASLGAQGPAVQAGIAKYLDMVPMTGAGPHARRSPCRIRLAARPVRRNRRQDRPRDLHADEDRVRRSRGAGPAGHGRLVDHAAEAQPESLPGDHCAVG